jgi:hypothetical protein
VTRVGHLTDVVPVEADLGRRWLENAVDIIRILHLLDRMES